MKVLRVCIPEAGSVVLEHVDLPAPGPGEVTVRVLRAGICGSDMHTYRRGHPWLDYPVRPGHEISGVIADLGPGVTALEVGQSVYVNPVVNCGRCPYCEQGRVNLCDQLVGIGSHLPGGMAEALNIPARAALPTPPAVPPIAASLIEPGATTARAVGRAGALEGRTVAVLGASTIGLLTTGMAVAAGPALVLTTDLREEKRRLSTEWGADLAVDGAGDDVVGRVLEKAERRPDVVFDCVGSARTFAVAAGVIAKAGTIVVVGADHGDASLPLGDIQDREVTVTGVAMYTPADVSAAQAFVADHVALVSGLVSAEFPVSQAPEAFRLAASGTAVKVQLVGRP
jgi:L-iditol 2-dehydrogenase